jgi:hypothetical protein
MAVNVAAVRAGMQHQLSAALGLEVQVATAPDQLTPPCLLIGMPSIDYHASFARGLDVMMMPIYGVLPRIHDQAAVDQADAWIAGVGPQSVRVILEDDPTLDGACQTLGVGEATAELWDGPVDQLPAYHWAVEVWG